MNRAVEDAGLETFEANTHPFVVKVWLEEAASETGRARWRGYITHVPSGERRYVETLAEIDAFIASYLEEMGVEPDLGLRVQQWLRRQKEAPTGKG